MPYTINYDQATDCILVIATGELDSSLLQNIAFGVLDTIKKHECSRVLSDLRDAKLTRDTLDIYQMPDKAMEAGVSHGCKRALVVGDRSSEFRFLETMFVNRGHNVKMFTGIDDARDWLFGN